MLNPSHALLLLLLAAPPVVAQDALAALNAGHADEAIAAAQSVLAANPRDAVSHNILCRADYALNLTEDAVKECQAAAEAVPASSLYQLWLGRAYGQKAEHAGMFAAMSLAKKVHSSFERAVQLDPANMNAAGDLGEYYIAAPGIVGGGQDKAAALAQSILARFPAPAHRLLALSAEKSGNLPKAEAEFKLAGNAADALVDLANFYRRHNRLDETVAVIRQALAQNPHGPVLVDAASILGDANRNPELAEKTYRDYLRGPGQTDAAPAFRVLYQLGRLLDKRGDHAAAKAEYNAALALASRYQPARKALAGR